MGWRTRDLGIGTGI